MPKKHQYPVFNFEAIEVNQETLPGGEVTQTLLARINNRLFQFIRYNYSNRDIVISTKFSTTSLSDGELKQAVIKALKE
jgi:hypothetical protein